MRKVSAADANRHFSKILGEVKAGATVLVTSRGEPVARIEPVSPENAEARERARAIEDLRAHLRSVKPMNIPITWTRADLYEADV
jgi:prevent-host-death family protein